MGYAMGSSEIRNFQELLDLRSQQVSDNVKTSSEREHRLEFVKTFRDVDFVNDAASVSENSIYMAMSSLTKNAVWITSFQNWDSIGVGTLEKIVQRVDAIIFYGEEEEQARDFSEKLNVHFACSDDLETAVRMAFYTATQRHVVLFSPGTPTDDIALRGQAFKCAVAQL